MLQCSGPAGSCVTPREKHAADTLPMPVRSPGLQCSGDTCSFSCLCANTSLRGREQPLAFPSRKAASQLEGNAGYSFGNTKMTSCCQRGFTPLQQACLLLKALPSLREVFSWSQETGHEKPRKTWPGKGRRAELLLSTPLQAALCTSDLTCHTLGPALEQRPAQHSTGRARKGHPTGD